MTSTIHHFAFSPRNVTLHFTKMRKSVDDGYMGHFWIYTKSIYAVPFL